MAAGFFAPSLFEEAELGGGAAVVVGRALRRRRPMRPRRRAPPLRHRPRHRAERGAAASSDDSSDEWPACGGAGVVTLTLAGVVKLVSVDDAQIEVVVVGGGDVADAAVGEGIGSSADRGSRRHGTAQTCRD